MRRQKDDEKRIRKGLAGGIPADSELEAFAKRTKTTPSRAASVIRIVRREKPTRDVANVKRRGRKPEKKAVTTVTPTKFKSEDNAELSDEG